MTKAKLVGAASDVDSSAWQSRQVCRICHTISLTVNTAGVLNPIARPTFATWALDGLRVRDAARKCEVGSAVKSAFNHAVT